MSKKMITDTKALISDIDAFINRTGLKPTTFGLYVMNDGKFYNRVCKGGAITERNLNKVYEFIKWFEHSGKHSYRVCGSFTEETPPQEA